MPLPAIVALRWQLPIVLISPLILKQAVWALDYNPSQKGDFMFRPSTSQNNSITIYIDDEAIQAVAGESVAAILLKQGITAVHSAPDKAARGPYCMMGVCFDCMVECEDGRSEHACQLYAEEGMKVYLPVTKKTGART